MTVNDEKIRLRWRYDFAARPSVWGQWCKPATHAKDMAAFNNREGLIRASIEAQDVRDDLVYTVCECDGWNFVNFEWVAICIGFDAEHQKIIGMSIVTRTERCQIFVDGSSRVLVRDEDDLKTNYATFGR